jgi:protein-tyrosine phosphatase
MAEAVFGKLVDDAGLSHQIRVDSAGTGAYHIGERAHPGTRQVLRRHGIPYNGRARQVRPIDMSVADNIIIVMDSSNLSELKRRYGHHPRLFRLLDFAKQADPADVPDPYYSGRFEEVYQLVKDGCQGLLEMIRNEYGI